MKRKVITMPRRKKENLVHFDIDTLSKQTSSKDAAQPASLGQALRAKREKKKLTLEEVAKKLCIKEVYLHALEDGHYYAFPNRVYGIGFLRSYSKFLGLDADMMVAQFHAETSDLKEAPLDMPVIEKHLALPSKKFLGLMFGVMVIFLIIWFAIAFWLNTDIFEKVSMPQPVEEVPQQTEVLAPETEEQVPAIVDEATPVPEEVQSVVQPEPAPAAPQAPAPVPEKEIDAAVFQAKAAFVAQKDVWVRLYNTETKKVILEKVLKKNYSFIPESDLKVLEVTTGRGNLLDLYKNGQKVKTFGQEKNRSLAEFAD